MSRIPCSRMSRYSWRDTFARSSGCATSHRARPTAAGTFTCISLTRPFAHQALVVGRAARSSARCRLREDGIEAALADAAQDQAALSQHVGVFRQMLIERDVDHRGHEPFGVVIQELGMLLDDC